MRWAILPNSVCIPVAKTAALPAPDATDVPASRILRLYKRFFSREGLASRPLGRDSPVLMTFFNQPVKCTD